jgi:3-deoxy-D-manno-octulosonate 8-phosphate phosphatase (KDO 8-P phosphatase)
VNLLKIDSTPERVFLLDVDGVMTDGGFYYSEEGKLLKRFGPEDGDALGLLKEFINIRFISADERGFAISKRRIVTDMGYDLDLVSATDRLAWIEDKYELSQVIYMGDSFRDIQILKRVGFGIAPGSAPRDVQTAADYVTERFAGYGAVSEACFEIATRFNFRILEKFD